MKSRFYRRLSVSAAVLLGLGGAILSGAPALAAPTAQPTAGATSSAAVADSSDLVLTSPKLDEDYSAQIHGTRSVTLTGTAPTGSKLQVSNGEGDVIASVTTSAPTFSIPLTFAADAGYDQYLSLFGKAGARTLTEIDFDLVFDAPTSATPTITGPLTGTAYQTNPAPFAGGEPNAFVEFTGRGTPGEDINLYTSSPGDDEDDYYEGGQEDEITVADDGTWSADFYVEYGPVTVTASQALYNEDGDAITVESDDSDPVTITVTKTAGVILPPVITAPDYDGLSFSAGVNPGSGTIFITTYSPSSLDSAARSATRSVRPSTQAAKLKAAASRDADKDQTRPSRGVAQTKIDTLVALGRLAEAKDDSGFESLDSLIDEYGIPVKGVPSVSTVGAVDMTVTGTGTPGQGIVLYEEKADPAFTYLQGLYPTLFADDGAASPLEPDTAGRVAPAAIGTGDPAATSTLPAFDGTVRVGADGTWTATLSRVPGNYMLTAFAVNGDGAATADYSVASDALLVHLTGTPRAAAAATAAAAGAAPELAFTGFNAGPVLAVGLGSVVAGALVLAASRRRRRSR